MEDPFSVVVVIVKIEVTYVTPVHSYANAVHHIRVWKYRHIRIQFRPIMQGFLINVYYAYS